MDDSVAGAQGHAAPVGDELGQGAVRDHIHRLRVGGSVAERLHHEVRLEAQASQILKLIAGHGPGGVLGAHRPHAGLAVSLGS